MNLAKYGLGGFPAAIAGPDVISRYYMKLVPRTLLVSGNGRVEKVWRGAVTSDDVRPHRPNGCSKLR